jgi:glutaredoxin
MDFVVYSKDGCPFCDKVKFVLNSLKDSKGCSLVVYNLGEHFNREEFYNNFGQGSTFPQVVYNGKNIGGCVDTVKYLQENNLL